MDFMLSEISKSFGLSHTALRYYAQEGILSCLRKDESGRYHMDAADLNTITFIVSLKNAGCSMKEIAFFIKENERSKSMTEDHPEMYTAMIERLYQHWDDLMEKQNELLKSMQYTKYLIWRFETFKDAGTSYIENEDEYPYSLPEPDKDESHGLMTYDAILKEYRKKYPHYPRKEKTTAGYKRLTD